MSKGLPIVSQSLTVGQRKRGVIFSSALLTFYGQKDTEPGVVSHEVYANDSDRNEKIARLRDTSFFRNGESPYQFNLIRD